LLALIEDLRKAHGAGLGIGKAAKTIVSTVVYRFLPTRIFDIDKGEVRAIFAKLHLPLNDLAGGSPD
jgi:hypothetical protein